MSELVQLPKVAIILAVAILGIAAVGAMATSIFGSLHAFSTASDGVCAYREAFTTFPIASGGQTVDMTTVGANDVYFDTIGSDGGKVRHFDGATITTVLTVAALSARQMTNFGANDVWVDGAESTTGGSYHFDGATWTQKNIGLGDSITWRGMSGSDSTHLYAVGQGGSSSLFDQRVRFWNGANWNKVTVNEAQTTLRAVYTFSPTNVFIGGDGGYFGHFDGNTWQPITFPTSESLLKMSATADGTLWIAASNGFYNYANGALSQETLLAGAFRVTGTQNIVFGSGGPIVALYTDAWHNLFDHTDTQPLGFAFGYNGISAASPDLVYAVGNAASTTTNPIGFFSTINRPTNCDSLNAIITPAAITVTMIGVVAIVAVARSVTRLEN